LIDVQRRIPALGHAPGARAIDEQAPHHVRRDREEVRAVPPAHGTTM